MTKARPRREGLIHYDSSATARSIKVSARNALGQFTNFQGAILRANRRSIEYLSAAASKNLTTSISAHGRPQDLNSGRLKRAIENPASHSASVDGFTFMIDDVVRPEVPYYRAIERGSDYWVGKRLPFLFLSGGNQFHANNPSSRRDPLNSSGTHRSDHIVGPRQFRTLAYTGQRSVVTIRNPVPRYGYAAKARRQFLNSKQYDVIVNEEATAFKRATGATIEISL